jgi:hypothetical protein
VCAETLRAHRFGELAHCRREELTRFGVASDVGLETVPVVVWAMAPVSNEENASGVCPR